jgi:hypothetical protein
MFGFDKLTTGGGDGFSALRQPEMPRKPAIRKETNIIFRFFIIMLSPMDIQ